MEEKKQTDSKKNLAKKQSILFKVNKKGLHVSGWMNLMRFVVVPAARIFYPFKIIGKKNVPDQCCIFVSNHYRMLDPMYIVPLTKEGVHFVCKKEALDFPILGFVIKKLKTICVNRDGNDVRALMDAQKCLKNGDRLAIYPEGTRNKTNEAFLPFNPGSSMLAIRAKVPIVPIVIYQKARIFRWNSVIVGKPIEFTEYYDVKLTDDILKSADEKILSAMLELKNQEELRRLNKRKR